MASLKQERSSWITQYREISEYLLPRTGRFLTSDRNRGDKRHNAIYDSTGTKALRTLSAGMMAGMTSPARPWFRLATSDPDLMEVESVRQWLDAVSTLMRDIYARSNTYRALHSVYEELGAYATAATIIEPDYENVIHHHPLTAGEYVIACNDQGVTDTLGREYDMTVANIVRQFVRQRDNSMKWENVSIAVKNLWDRGQVDEWVPVTHLIEPRELRDPTKRDSKNMPVASCYIESSGNEDKYLRESGYKRFPALCPRWGASGGDVYGNGPGMDALGDVKQLQHQQLRKAHAIDYQVKPPLQMPTALKNQQRDTLPGGVLYHDMNSPHSKITSLWDVNLNLDHLGADIRDVRERINGTFFADLFLFMNYMDSAAGQRQITAREIAERHEEKLIMLGPVTERQHNELLSPKIDITFDRIVEAGLLRGRLAPPKELQDGVDINIEFVSMLAQAQRAVGLAAVDRYLGTIIAIGNTQALSGQPTIADKVNGDQIADKVADMLGIDPDFVVADDKVAIIRKQRAQAMQAAQVQAALPEMARAAKDASQADTENSNLLTNVMGRFSGYGANA